MAGKLSMGNNHSTFKNVSIDAGVKGMQGKATETRKTAILTEKKLIRLKCIWRLRAS